MAFEKTKKKLAEAIKKARLKKAYKKEGMDKKAAKAKAKVKSKAPETGKIRKGAVGVKSTKGGEYAKYKKKSKAAKSFRSAFADARKEGKSTFSWDGRSYSTARADDKKKTTAKPKTKAKKLDVTHAVKSVAKAKAKTKEKTYPKPTKEETAAAKQRASEWIKEHHGDKKKKVEPPKAPKPSKAPEPWKAPKDKYRTNYKHGGKVESNPYGWPSKDSRGKK